VTDSLKNIGAHIISETNRLEGINESQFTTLLFCTNAGSHSFLAVILRVDMWISF